VIDWFEESVSPTVLCAMFHNVELVPGKSPYCKTEADCRAMFDRIERIFAVLQQRGYAFKTLREIEVAA
jgi:hypothetical protein